MSRNLPIPYFPVPPTEYQSEYMQDIVRRMSSYMNQLQNPGEGRNTQLVLTNLQEDDIGLETGALFQQDGFVKIVLNNRPHVRGITSICSVGTVTVNIS